MDASPYIELLQKLIRLFSPSGSEDKTADTIADFFTKKNIPFERFHNNIIAKNKFYNEELPLLILNSHHDTVQIGGGWQQDPLGGEVLNGRLYGRGSNDAGGALVGLIAAFCHFYEKEIPFNLMIIASGEEENFGPKGVSSVLRKYQLHPNCAIIGEPTNLEVGIAEKGLIVIDAVAEGESVHAAREGGINALYRAVEDIRWIRNYKWPKVSEILGPVKTTVTQINSGTQHNVIPDRCSYVIDCRINENFSLHEVLSILDEGTHALLTPRSLKWKPSGISPGHNLVKKAKELDWTCFGSPTLSDQVHFLCPSIKMGPGDSQRSHTADEFIGIEEIEEGIQKYIALLDGLKLV